MHHIPSSKWLSTPLQTTLWLFHWSMTAVCPQTCPIQSQMPVWLQKQGTWPDSDQIHTLREETHFTSKMLEHALSASPPCRVEIPTFYSESFQSHTLIISPVTTYKSKQTRRIWKHPEDTAFQEEAPLLWLRRTCSSTLLKGKGSILREIQLIFTTFIREHNP